MKKTDASKPVIASLAFLLFGCRAPTNIYIMDWSRCDWSKLYYRPAGDPGVPLRPMVGHASEIKADVIPMIRSKMTGLKARNWTPEKIVVRQGLARPEVNTIWMKTDPPPAPFRDVLGLGPVDRGDLRHNERISIYLGNFMRMLNDQLSLSEWKWAIANATAHEIGHTLGFDHSEKLGNGSIAGQIDLMRVLKGTEWHYDPQARFAWEQKTSPFPWGTEYDVVSPLDPKKVKTAKVFGGRTVSLCGIFRK